MQSFDLRNLRRLCSDKSLVGEVIATRYLLRTYRLRVNDYVQESYSS